MSRYNNLNTIPVKTYRWLKINDISLKENYIPKYNEYKKEFINIENTENYNLIKTIDSPLYSELLSNDFGVSTELVNEAIENFNAGFSLTIKKDFKLKEPKLVNFKVDELNPELIDYNIIKLEENSEASLVINYSSDNNIQGYHNGVTKIVVADGAKLNLIIIQDFNSESLNFNSVVSHIYGSGEINFIPMELGSLNTITNYHSSLLGEKSKSYLNSIYIGDKERKIDINYIMNHFGKGSLSEIKTKGVLMDKSKKTFRGTLDFKKGASKSKGIEDEFVMLLSPKVRNNSIPLLLCEEHDVEGQHAASAGKIDEDTLFYLMSRGLSEKDSKKLLVEAYLKPVIEKIPFENLKLEILETLKGRLNNV
ncbi:Iron-regulated ABC transporter permease protein SufD [Clostridium cavendishii DSM 21758]|uniref:Iron-regulated ABC transporter permease protein SufD n=1 Tax=Clostridium cavendishii DSM 21758 TaxID=1121302 RepID=A0A1M6AD68_9CLOT|nr:Fe-S cluster assembly protein SufD [Clostridium cavendishii]SHI34163.1 Iron-regulated ABC transporter permease protein SufD [Clostridium cavendishii DSM 21758]